MKPLPAKLRLFCLGWLAAASVLHAQAPNFAYSYRSVASPVPVGLAPAGTIIFPNTAVGATSTVTLILTNKGDTTWSVTDLALSGATYAIVTSANPDVPAGQDLLVNLSFIPTTGKSVEETLRFTLRKDKAAFPVIFFLTGTGLAPNLLVSYVLAADGNQVIPNPNDTIQFGQTAVEQTSAATLIISNKGNGAGKVLSVGVTGTAFKLSGLPIMPAEILPQAEIRLTLTFGPAAQGNFNGSLTIQFAQSAMSLALAGAGVAPAYLFEAIVNSTASTISTGGAISFPAVAVGVDSNLVIRISNSGNAKGTVGAISISGAAFRLANVPPLPLTLAPNQSISFGVTYTPMRAGSDAGTLRIDSAAFSLAGTGLGFEMAFALRQGSTVTPLAGATLTFANTSVGTRSSAIVQVRNTGTVAGNVSSISISGDPYKLDTLPALPASIQPGDAVEFSVVFAPGAMGNATGAVRVDAQTLALAGVGVAPQAIPAVSFGNLADPPGPGQQPAIGIQLDSAYPLDITGKLTMTFASEAFADDPAIQFVTGGRTVIFTIPANTRQAVFGQGATQVQLQTGTIAGKITVTPLFLVGEANVTPSPVPVKTISIAAAPPQLSTVQIGTRTAGSFEVLVTGFSTARSVTQLNLQFAAASGAVLQPSSLSLNVQGPFTAWYQAPVSAAYGSQFTAVVNVTVAGDMNAVGSVSVTALNDLGSSSPLTANLR